MHTHTHTEPTITKDNPAFSMMNDSDEDVIYGSDEESRKPLTGKTASLSNGPAGTAAVAAATAAARQGNEYDSD